MTLLLVTLALANDTFYPGEGPELVSFADIQREGAVVGRTGRLLVKGDEEVIKTLPGVGTVIALRGGVLEVTPKPGTDDLELSRRLAERPDVAWAHPDLLLHLVPRTVPNDPLLPDEWHLDNTGQGGRTVGVDINAPMAWELASGDGVLIAVIDSGVQLDHPDLEVIAGYDYLDRDNDPSPDGSTEGPHGTCAAGLAAATGDNGYGVAGVAWGASIYAIRLIGGTTSTRDVYDAFIEAVDAGAGGALELLGIWRGLRHLGNYSVFNQMLTYAEDEGRGGLGSVVAFAAGNGACDIENDSLLAHDTLVVVAATESNDVRAWYSSFGDSVDISAPTTVLTTDMVGGGYGSYGGDDAIVDGFNGTSASTPIVAGVVALMLEANPRITAAGVREALCRTAVRNDVANAGYNSDGWSPYYGCGRIDAGAAVAAVANTAPSAPVPLLSSAVLWDGRVQLFWEVEDPDGDVLDYDLSWSVGEDTHETTLPSNSADLTGEVEVGDTVSWTVRARDPWGEGPWSEPATFEVTALPPAEPPQILSAGGCQTGQGSSAAGLLMVAAGLLSRGLRSERRRNR